MAQSSASLHEAADTLKPGTVDRHRAIVSLMEELEAIDWYDQRADATGDEELRAILVHNRDEEKEHAVMALEWLRRHDAALDRVMKAYLFTEVPILEIEERIDAAEAGEDVPSPDGDGSLGIGSLKDGGRR